MKKRRFFIGARVFKQPQFYGIGKYPKRGATTGTIMGMSLDAKILYVLGDGNKTAQQTPASHWELLNETAPMNFVISTMDV